MEPTPLDQYNQVGKSILIDKLETFVDRSETIKFVMLGYPFKSTNTRDKVLGSMPDMAEEVSLKNFARFNTLIREVYSPGIDIGIASDNFIFNDILNVPDSTVERYKEIVYDMGRVAPMSWYNLENFFSGSLNDKREKLMNQLAPTQEKLEQEILLNPDTNFLYRGMTRFMMEELADKGFVSGNQLQKAAKKLTREMMIRNEAWSNLVKTEFGDRIRLSMHPSVNNGAKFSFKLIPGRNTRHSPWHSALLVDGNNHYATLHKKDAIEDGYELVYKDGRPYNFQSLDSVLL